MTEQEYKQTLNLIENSVFANMPLQWVETFQSGIGQMIANIEREVTEWADLNKPIWDSDPAQSGTYNAVKSELLAFAQNLQKYKDDPARSEVIYDFINAARSLYSFNKNYGLDRTPLTNAENPFKLSIVSSRVAAFGYMHFKNLANLVKFNEDLLASIDSEKIQLKDHTKTVLEPVREKLYKLITEDPEFKNLLDELGFGEVDDFIQSFAPGNGVSESLTDEFFSNFNTFVGNISARLDTERQTTDLAIAEARADAQESIDDALERVDQLVADLSTYQTGINTQIQTIESAYESLNTIVQSNVSRIGATEAAIIQEASTRADGFVATAARIDGMVSRIDAVDASIIQEANTRASEDAATADRIDQLVTRVDDNAAAIINEQNARTTALLAEATARETLAAQLKSDSELYASGLVTTESNVRAAQDEVLGERIDLVSAEVGGISTAILDEQTARITGDEVEATSRKALSTKLFGTDVIDGVTVDTLTSGFLYDQQQSIITQTESVVTAATGQIAQIQTDLTNTKADLLTETTTRVNEYGAIATSVTVLSTEVNNQKATLDSLNSIVSGPDGITTQWGIKSDINGYITGVGLISSSKYGTPTSQFIVYADQFALVTPGVNGGQPTLPFFVGSEQGYLELSNTVKSNWNNITGSNKPADNATRNVHRGDWTTNTLYQIGDTVIYQGYGWSCTTTHTSSVGVTPPVYPVGFNDNWTLASVKGADSKSVYLTSSSYVFRIAQNGTVSPASITLTAVGQNIAGEPTFEVQTGTATLSGSGGVTRTLTAANLTSEQATIKITWDGLEDFVTVTKIREGSNGITVVSSNEAHVLPADKNGAVTSYTNSGTTIQVFEGSIALNASSSATVSAFRVGTITQSPASTITVGTVSYAGTTATIPNHSAMANGTDSVVLTIPVTVYRADGSSIVVNKIQTISKSKTGATGAAGTDALTIVVSNEAHTLPASSTGAVSSYTNSGTTIQVFEGATALNAVSSIAANGQFTIGTPVLSPAASITVGNRTYSGTTATVAQHQLMLDGTDSILITYPVSIRRSNGANVTINCSQTITKSKAGARGAQGPAVVVTANRALTFTATDSVLDGSQASIVLTAAVSGITSPTYVWTFSGLQTNPTASTTSSQTITAAQFGTSKSATVTCTVSGAYTDQVTIVRLETSTAAPYATVGAPAGTFVAGVAANTVATATTNFNASNDRNSSAIAAPTIATNGSAVDHVEQKDGSVDISFEWAWGGAEGDIDGFLVFVRQSSSSAAYTFGTTPAEETVYTVPANKRAFVLFGVAADQYYTFGIQAYRSVDKDVDSTGSIKSSLAKTTGAGENPYRPRSSVAFSGNVIGTIAGTTAAAVVTNASTALTNASNAQIAADSANNKLADIAADNKLTAVEKQSAANEWGIINRERASIQAQAAALGISAELGDYNYTYAVLNDYITPLLSDLQSTSAIDGPTFRDKWSYFYEYRQRLLNKMAAVAATKADWASVTGSGKPENGATVGADSSNLKSGPGVNMVFNGDYIDGLAGTTVGWRSAGNQHTLSRNLSGYIVQGEGTAYIQQPGSNGTALFDANIWNGQEGQCFAVTPGKKYEISAWLNCHRCEGRMGVLFLDAAGAQLHHAVGNAVTHQGSITSIADMRQSWAIVTAPATAVKAQLIVRGYNTGLNDPYVFFSRVYFGEAGAGQTEPSLWSPGRGISQITPSNVTTYIANAAIGAAQIGSIELVGESAFKVRTNNTAGARMDMDSRRIKIFDASGTLRVQLGDLTV